MKKYYVLFFLKKKIKNEAKDYELQPFGINLLLTKSPGTFSISVPKVSFHRFKKPNKEITETIIVI